MRMFPLHEPRPRDLTKPPAQVATRLRRVDLTRPQRWMTVGEAKDAYARLRRLRAEHQATTQAAIDQMEDERRTEAIRQGRRSLAESSHRWATAAHESGHAVACVLANVRFTIASVTPDDDNGTLGHVRFGNDLDECDARGVVLQAYCGEAAEALLCGTPERQLNRADAAIARLGASRMQGSNETIFSNAKQMARVFVRQYRAKIDRVARELVDKRWLDYQAVQRLVRG